ncbi:MAG: heat-inducible transcription repressor HrcA [Bacteroidota bacterium]|nr:heat-inducible transcription repressor HrcA [Bacteroidota bacterium]
MSEDLTEREKTILRNIIHSFIRTATPVGSRYISRRHAVGLSPASVRNVMADLEYLGYIDHPHTSAGRVPTDKGYRLYVDSLIALEELSEAEQWDIQTQLHNAAPEINELLKATSKLLGTISHQLGVVSSPHIAAGVFEKLELVQVSSRRVLVIISIRSGLVRTIMMDVRTEIPKTKLVQIAQMLNERFSGMTLAHVRKTFSQRVQDLQQEETGLIRLFIDSLDKLFTNANPSEKLHIGGTQSLLSQPEFIDTENFRSIIEILENEDVIVHILEKKKPKEGKVSISIGKENEDRKLRDYTIVSSQYAIGDTIGTISVFGPKRMNYSKVIPVVDYVAKTISSLFASGN